MTIGRFAILFAHGLIGWALCGAIIAIGRSLTSMDTTLIIHASGVPVIFFFLSLVYFRFFHFTTPLQTALFFTALAIAMDLFVVALLVEKSFSMFASVLGTWIPFALIFAATYLTGRWIRG